MARLYTHPSLKKVARQAFMDDATRDELIQQLGNYDDLSVDRNKEGTAAFDHLQQCERTKPDDDPNKALFTGIDPDKPYVQSKEGNDYRENAPLSLRPYLQGDRSDPQFFRKAFIRYLQDRINNHVKPYTPKEPDLRETEPEGEAIKLEALLGAKKGLGRLAKSPGIELFKRAMEEEVNSKAFRTAVFNKSASFFPGKKWAKRLLAIIGGASASGKSFATKNAISRTQSLLGTDPNSEGEPGNFVIAGDGGVVREVSQMRNLIIEASVAMGYPGITDLHDETSSILEKVKGYVAKAALKTKELGVAKPLTFANPFERYGLYFKEMARNIKRFLRLESDPNNRSLFIMVQPHDLENQEQLETFRDAVYFMGNKRAFKKEWPADKKMKWGLNQTNGVSIPESKRYGAKHFGHGLFGSLKAMKMFRFLSKDGFCIRSYNDLTAVKDRADSKEATILVSKRVLARYEKFKAFMKENPNAILKIPCKQKPNGEMLFSQQELSMATESLKAYLDLCNNQLSPSFYVNHNGQETEILGPQFLPSEMQTSAEINCQQALDQLEKQLAQLKQKLASGANDPSQQIKIHHVEAIVENLKDISKDGASGFTDSDNREAISRIQREVQQLHRELQGRHQLKGTKTMKSLEKLEQSLGVAQVEMDVKAVDHSEMEAALKESSHPSLFQKISGVFHKHEDSSSDVSRSSPSPRA